jgi:hypothetical protein
LYIQNLLPIGKREDHYSPEGTEIAPVLYAECVSSQQQENYEEDKYYMVVSLVFTLVASSLTWRLTDY